MNSFTVITGRSGAGKTARLLSDAARTAQAGGRILLLIPEPYTYDGERALMEALGGPLFDAEALGFSRLAERVLRSSSGLSRLFLSADGKRMALRRVLSDKAGELSLYRRVSARSGFSRQAGDLIDLFKSADVDPGQLRAAAQTLDDPLLCSKLQDIALLYEGLEDFMAGRYIDAEDAQALLIEQIPHSPYLRGLHVYMDFPHSYMYTAQTYQVIGGLIGACASFTMTLRLPQEDDPDRSLFSAEERTLQKLRALGRLTEIRLPEKQEAAPGPAADPRPAAVRAVEKLLFSGEIPKVLPDAGGLSLCAAANVREEVDAALRHIDSLLASDARPGDIYLVPGDAALYGPALRAGLARRGLTLFWEERQPLSSHPVVELAIASLQAALRNLRREEVLRAAKSGFSPLENSEAELFEDYVLRFGIGYQGFLEPFHRGGDSRPALLLAAEEARKKLIPPLCALRDSLKACKTARDCCQALYEYLLSIGLWERLNETVAQLGSEGRLDAAAENTQVWNALLALLDQIAELMDGPMEPEQFVQVLDEGFAAHTIGLIPPALDQIGCGDVQTASGRSLVHLLVLGCSEGSIPAAAGDDGIINDRDIARLSAAGIDAFTGTSGRAAHERHIVYALLSRPTGSLFVSWPLSDSEGKLLSPSSVADRLCALFPSALFRAERLPAAEAACEEEGFFALVRALRQLADSGEEQEGLKEVYAYYAAHPDYSRRLSEAEARLFGGEGMSAKDAAALYGGWRGSTVTRLEQFNSCPFSYLVTFGLRPDPRKPYEESAPDEGSFYHAALNAFSRKIKENHLEWDALTDSMVEELLSGICQDLFATHNSGILSDGAQNRRLGGQMERALLRTMKSVVKQVQAGRFTPALTEAELGKELPALTLTLSDGTTARLLGKIDRIDLYNGAEGIYTRIIDYKTGPSSFSYAELTSGLQLQLPLYLKAAAALGEPAGMFYLHISDPVDEAFPGEAKEEDEEVKHYRLKGLLLADPEVVRAMDSQSSGGFSPYIPVRFGKEGVSGTGGSLLSGEQLRLILSCAETTAARTVERILAGDASVDPAQMGNWSACDWCDYRSICRFEPNRDGLFRTIGKLPAERFFAQLQELDGSEPGKPSLKGESTYE